MTTLIPKYDLKNGGSTPTGAINRPFNDKLEEFISVKDFGAVGNGVTDDSIAFTNTLNAVINAGGGTIWIPAGTYVVDLNWSTQVIAQDYNTIVFQGAGTTSTTLLGKTGATAVLTINRGGTGDNWLDTRMIFRDLEFKTESNVCNGGTPVISYAVQMLRCSSAFYNVNFSGGSKASYYGTNSQYAKFVDCWFICASLTPSGGAPSAGCWIQSDYISGTVADQMTFDRCTFGNSQNGLYIQGCQQLRVTNSRFQGCFNAGEGGLVIKDYTTGGGSEAIFISSCHFEGNAVRDIYLPSQTNRTLIQQCVFGNPIGYVASFVANIEQIGFSMTYISNDFRTASGPTITLTGDNASLVYLGNDKSPYSFTSSGSTQRSIIQNSTTGTIDFQYSELDISGYFGSTGLKFATPVTGGTYLWVSATGVLRIKSGSAPTSDGDGVAVGSQT